MNLYLRQWIRNKFPNPPITFLDLCCTWRCNAKCIICNAWQRGNISLNKGQTDVILHNPYFKNLEKIIIEGGEPTLWPNLVYFCNNIRNEHSKLKEVVIITNGIATEKITKIADKLDSNSVRWVVSLDGYKESHDRSRGIKGAFEKTTKTIKILHDKFDVRIQFLPTFYSLKDIDFIKDFSTKYATSYSILYPSLSNKFSKYNVLPDKEELDRILGDDTKRQSIVGKYLSLLYLYKAKNQELMPCLAGRSVVCIMPDGNIQPCSFHDKEDRTIGSINQNDRIEFTDIDYTKIIPKTCQYVNERLCDNAFVYWSIRRNLPWTFKELLKMEIKNLWQSLF